MFQEESVDEYKIFNLFWDSDWIINSYFNKFGILVVIEMINDDVEDTVKQMDR